MFPRFREHICVSCSSALLQKLNFSVSCQLSRVNVDIYKPQVLNTKSRSGSKVRKVNLSRKLREEFAKHKGQTPIISCKRWEFNFYEGMKYGKFEPVPLASKGWASRGSNGDFFTLYERHIAPNKLHFGNIHLPKNKNQMKLILPQEENYKNDDKIEFSMLGIESNLVEALQRCGIKTPADIQVAAIPQILQEKNCVLSAHTGCGKTLAYLLPIIQMTLKNVLKEKGESVPLNSPMTLILTPSRELACQIQGVLQKLLEGLPLTSRLLVGGHTYERIEPDIREQEVIDIVVGSLGVLRKRFATGALQSQRIKHIVLDEADQLADDLNYSSVKRILRKVPIKQNLDDERSVAHDESKAQIVLVSATLPTNLERLFEDLVNVDSLERINTTYLHDVLKNVPQLFLKVGKIHKGKTLIDIIEKDSKLKRPVVIFCNKIKTADWVSLQLNDCGFPCKNLTSCVPNAIREHLFERFQAGEFNILATTPMVARGLDTVRVQHIINFEFPLYMSEYIHQIGRVGRIGSSHSCHITNIISHLREVELVQKIELSVRLGEKLTAVNANIPGILRHRHDKLSMAS